MKLYENAFDWNRFKKADDTKKPGKALVVEDVAEGDIFNYFNVA